MLHTLEHTGLAGLIEATKSAASYSLNSAERSAAAALLCKSARLSPLVTAVAAAEFQDLVPQIYNNTAAQGEAHLEKLAGLASLLNLTFFRPEVMSKAAAVNPVVMSELKEALLQQGMTADDVEDQLTSDAGGSLSEDSEGGAADGSMDQDDEIRENSSDLVDNFLELEDLEVLGDMA